MARFNSRRKNPAAPVILLVAVFAALLIFFNIAVNLLMRGNMSREKESLESALERDITYCYALEGRYPNSLDEIRNDYGLLYDTDRFFVDYQVRGANIRPDVTVLVRSGDSSGNAAGNDAGKPAGSGARTGAGEEAGQ